MTDVKIKTVNFNNFKALKHFKVSLQNMNVIVGPNNCGKSTLISAFRILDTALKKDRRIKPERVSLPNNRWGSGYFLQSNLINSVSLENVATDYNDDDTTIEFNLTNGNSLFLYFPKDGGCVLYAGENGFIAKTPIQFKSAFPLLIQVVPILGPLEHNEQIINEETVRSALNTHRASRHFRNYWKYYSEDWDQFAEMISETWPGMKIKPPEQRGRDLTMFVAENRIDREVYWAGFGFQVWCQMLTHISRANESSIIVIDEPEIYLHPDIQKQLLGILRKTKADVLIATHSVEIMSDAEPSEILLMDKKAQSAKRLKNEAGIQQVLDELGSVQNITLTKLARNGKILFGEGIIDDKIIRRFAGKLKYMELENGNDITFIESGGFSSWEKIKSFSSMIKKTIDSKLLTAGVYDRDYFCFEEIENIKEEMQSELLCFHIHQRKEIENYLLDPIVLQRTLEKQIKQCELRTGKKIKIVHGINAIFEEVISDEKDEIRSQL